MSVICTRIERASLFRCAAIRTVFRGTRISLITGALITACRRAFLRIRARRETTYRNLFYVSRILVFILGARGKTLPSFFPSALPPRPSPAAQPMMPFIRLYANSTLSGERRRIHGRLEFLISAYIRSAFGICRFRLRETYTRNSWITKS